MKSFNEPLVSLDDPAFAVFRRNIDRAVQLAFDKAALHLHDDKRYPLAAGHAFERAIADAVAKAPLLKRRDVAKHGKEVHKYSASERRSHYGQWADVDFGKSTPILAQLRAIAPAFSEVAGAAPLTSARLQRAFGAIAPAVPEKPAKGRSSAAGGSGRNDGAVRAASAPVPQNRLVLRVRRIECVKSTAELGRDEFELMGGAFDGITAPIAFKSKDVFGFDGFLKKKIKLKDGESIDFPQGAAICAFDTSKLPERQIYNFAAVILPFERDWAFSDPGKTLDSLLGAGQGALGDYFSEELSPSNIKKELKDLLDGVISAGFTGGTTTAVATTVAGGFSLAASLWAVAISAAVAGVIALVRRWLAHETFNPITLSLSLTSLDDLVDEDYIADLAQIEITNGKRARYLMDYDWRLFR